MFALVGTNILTHTNFRLLKGREQRVVQLDTEKKAIEEQRKLAADLKIEVSVLQEQAKVERMRMQEEVSLP